VDTSGYQSGAHCTSLGHPLANSIPVHSSVQATIQSPHFTHNLSSQLLSIWQCSDSEETPWCPLSIYAIAIQPFTSKSVLLGLSSDCFLTAFLGLFAIAAANDIADSTN
jgi:hypothetical protein